MEMERPHSKRDMELGPDLGLPTFIQCQFYCSSSDLVSSSQGWGKQSASHGEWCLTQFLSHVIQDTNRWKAVRRKHFQKHLPSGSWEPSTMGVHQRSFQNHTSKKNLYSDGSGTEISQTGIPQRQDTMRQAHMWTHTQYPERLGAVLNFHNFRSINTRNLSKKSHESSIV